MNLTILYKIFQDYIGEGHQPVQDSVQNVKLISFNQTVDTTFVEFTRPIQTSDPQDLPIKVDFNTDKDLLIRTNNT
jgi:hypothetical protein